MDGDKPIRLDEPMFTHGEACEITGVPTKSLHNWLEREITKAGQLHRTGRRLYSIFDLIEIAALYELTNLVMVPPGNASHLAVRVRKRCEQNTERDAVGRLKFDSKTPKLHLLIWFEGDQGKVTETEGWDWVKKHDLQHPTILLPVDGIFARIVNRAFDVLQREPAAGQADKK